LLKFELRWLWVHNRVCSVFVIRVSVSTISTHEDAVDAAVPVDAQNAPTRTWKLQNSFHSANSAHPLFEKDLNQTEESGVSTLSRDFTKALLCNSLQDGQFMLSNSTELRR
jgi:hypothetical protein